MRQENDQNAEKNGQSGSKVVRASSAAKVLVKRARGHDDVVGGSEDGPETDERRDAQELRVRGRGGG